MMTLVSWCLGGRNVRISILLIFIFAIISCNSPKKEANTKAYADSAAAAQPPIPYDDPNMDGIEQSITCTELDNTSTVMQQVNENDSYRFIRYDSTQTFTFHGHFISADSNSTLVLVYGDSGPPCGTGCNMILLYRCDSVAELVLTDNMGWFTNADIRDLDNDGIPEITTVTDWMNMGECATYYQVRNFKGGKSNIIYENSGFQNVGCGMGDESAAAHHYGDTISLDIKSDLIDPDHDHIYEVQEYRDYRIFNGGKTEDEVLKKAGHKYDTVTVKLKK